MDEDNNLLPRENGDTANPTETERSRRLHLKRLGVIICFVLIFMDGGSPRADQRLHREEKVSDQSSRSQSLYTSKLNEVIKSKRNLNSPMLFARNITGVFHGNWDMNTGTANVSKSKREKTFLMQLRSVKLNNVPDLDFVYGVAKIYKAGVSESDLFYPLQGVFLATTGTLHLLSSVSATEMLFLQLPESPDSKRSTVPPPHIQNSSNGTRAEGAALVQENLSMRASSLPESNKTTRNASDSRNVTDRSATNNRIRSFDDSPKSKKRRRPRLLDGPASPWINTDVGTEDTDWDIVADAGAGQWQFAGGAGGMGSTGLDSLNALFLKGGVGRGSGGFSSEHRALRFDSAADAAQATESDPANPSAGGMKAAVLPIPAMSPPRSLSVGNTGMTIHLIDMSQPPLVIANTSSLFTTLQVPRSTIDMNPNLIQAIGESSLSANFKNLQRAAAFDASGMTFSLGKKAGGIAQQCQFSLTFSEAPMEGYKDPKKVFLNQLMPNTTHTEGDSGGVEEDAASLARRNAAYASSLFGHFDSSACGVSFSVTATSLHQEFEEVEKKASAYSFAASGVCFIQIALLVLQLRYSRTQAASTKISILCISAQSMLDAALCIAHLVLCAALPQMFFSHFMWVAILKLLLFGVFEMRTVITIYQARYAQEIAGESGLDGLRQRLAKVHLRFYAALFASVFVALYCRSVPMVAVFIFYSYWVPQIAWNIVSGTRRTFHPFYCIGTTASRLFIPLYLLGCPKNIFSVLLPGAIPFAPATCVGLVVWTMIQLLVLLAQDILGPRYCLPASMFPRAYDYYRPVPPHVLRGSHSTTADSSAEPGPPPDVESGGLIECVICYNVVEIDDGTYMITPCDHLFHKHCLEQWLTMKMECCICRSVLPPLEDS